MTNVTGCKAKNPSTCPYHGAAIRMTEATDFEAYYSARKDFEAAEKKMKRSIFGPKEEIVPIPAYDPERYYHHDEDDPYVSAKESYVDLRPMNSVSEWNHRNQISSRGDYDRDLDGYSAPFYDDRLEELEIIDNDGLGRDKLTEQEQEELYDYTNKKETAKKVNFLSSTKSVPTPMEAYALWLSLYEAQGGKVSKNISNTSYGRKDKIFGDNNTLGGQGEEANNDNVSYDDIGWRRWTPTQEGARIPAHYGSSAMELMILPDAVGQDLRPATNDHRDGWEFGHTRVYLIRKDPTSPYGFRAETNDSYARSYSDVEAYRRGKPINKIIEELGTKTGTNFKAL